MVQKNKDVSEHDNNETGSEHRRIKIHTNLLGHLWIGRVQT